MFKTDKIESTIEPQKLEPLNNGVWYYNFNIESEIIEEELRYKYSQVRILGKPTVSKCYEALFKVYINEDGVSLMDVMNSPTKTLEDELFAKSLYELVEIDFGLRPKPTELEIEKEKVIRAIDNYDTSKEVNSFFLNGLQVWLNKDTRVGLMNSLTIEKNSGKENSTLWFNNICVTIKCDVAMLMLSSLELYALECYNKTAEHKVAVSVLNSVEEVLNYDYTAGYPEKLSFEC